MRLLIENRFPLMRSMEGRMGLSCGEEAVSRIRMSGVIDYLYS
jgi:hypothetical protein